MLTYQHLHKQVNYYKSITGKEPERVYVYIFNGKGNDLRLIPSTDFHKYQFVEYTKSGSAYPVVTVVH
jgi:hypothetical protein